MTPGLPGRGLALVLALSLAASPAFSQEAVPAPAATGSGDAAAASESSGTVAPPEAAATPEAGTSVRPGALPAGFRKRSSENSFRRFEIIAFGAFPILLFYVGVGFDIGRYFTNGLDKRYAPWPFKGDNAVKPTESEYLARISVAAGASLAFAGADALIRAARFRRASELDSAEPRD